MQLRQGQALGLQLKCSSHGKGGVSPRWGLPAALPPWSLQGRGPALSCAVSRWAASPGCQASRKEDDALGALASGCVKGTHFHFFSISKAQGCECLRGRRTCAEPEAHDSVVLLLFSPIAQK